MITKNGRRSAATFIAAAGLVGALAACSTPSTGGNSGATLPETFTIDQFIAWLKEKTDSANAKRFAAAFADRIHARDFN